jgi:hypothetical protein
VRSCPRCIRRHFWHECGASIRRQIGPSGLAGDLTLLRHHQDSLTFTANTVLNGSEESDLFTALAVYASARGIPRTAM